MSALDALLGPASSPAGEWPDGLPDHLSASQVSQFMRCPEQYRQVKVLGNRARPGAALVWGSADHYAHEVNFAQKIESHTDLPVGDVQMAFAVGFDEAVERNGGESEVEWGSEKPAKLKDDGVALVSAYHTIVSPRIQPTAVEVDFRLEVPGSPVPVVGRVDLETAGPGIERKTAKRSSTKVEAKWRLQGLIYQLARTKEIDYHVSVKTKTPGVLTPLEHPDLALPYIPGRVRAVERLIAQTAHTIAHYMTLYGPDEPWPGALSHDWSCDYCGFRPDCHWWNG